MSYCFNPACPSPQNPKGNLFCQSCGKPLVLAQRYRVLKPIGQGGFGKTFLAIDEHFSHKPRCVVKQLLPKQGDRHSTEEVERFRQEVQRLMELGEHPQIPALIDHLEFPESHYLIQEFIEGQDFETALEEGGPFPERGIRQLLIDLLPVLDYIHSRRVIHRDIKPKNLIAPLDNRPVVLVDFGASKYATGTALARTGTVIGSAGFLAPEQAMGQAVFSSDLYSLGVTCIYLLTGIHPFELYSTSQNVWIWQQYLLEPVSDELAYVLNKMLRRTPNQRYRTATAALTDLRSPPADVTSTLTRRAPYQLPKDIVPKDIAVEAGYGDARSPIPTPPPRLGPDIHSPAHPWYCVHHLTGHEGAVTTVAISPSSQVLASGSTDHRIMLWNVQSGTRLHTFDGRSLWSKSGHADRITDLAFTPDGSVLISGSDDGTIKLWDLSNRTMLSTLSSAEWIISAIALSPDGNLLVSGGANGAIELWDLERGEFIEQLWRHRDRISSLAISPNGHHLLSSSYDGTICLWDLRTAELLNIFRGHRDRVGAIAVSSDWRVMVSGSWDGELTFWDLDYAEPIHTMLAHQGSIRCLAASPTGSLTGSPTGLIFASGGDDAQVNLWSVGDDDQSYLDDESFDDDPIERSHWPLEQIDCLCVLKHGWSINGLSFSPDGRVLASASADESIKVWQNANSL